MSATVDSARSSATRSRGFAMPINEPLSVIARWNNPRVSGEDKKMLMLIAPADWPNSVTFSAFPPNAAMFVRTQWSAAIWSNSP